MASLITHALVPLVVGAAVAPRERRGRFVLAVVTPSNESFELVRAIGDPFGQWIANKLRVGWRVKV